MMPVTTPIPNLFNVGDGCTPPGTIGTEGAAGSAREVVRLLEASARQAERDKQTASLTSPDREWTREDLYIRGDGGRGAPG
jgi:hypothetical protein